MVVNVCNEIQWAVGERVLSEFEMVLINLQSRRVVTSVEKSRGYVQQ